MTRILILAGAATLLVGCMSEGARRIDGLTPGAGNAIAANTAMQMVDPWQRGVEDTDLDVPAERTAAAASSDDSGADDGSSNDD